jgi:hypothetical protein
MPTYKKILSGYINDSKNGDGKYLSIKNNSDETVIIDPGTSIFLNMTPKEVRDKNPKVPMFSKSVKVEDEVEQTGEEISEDVPF